MSGWLVYIEDVGDAKMHLLQTVSTGHSSCGEALERIAKMKSIDRMRLADKIDAVINEVKL